MRTIILAVTMLLTLSSIATPALASPCRDSLGRYAVCPTEEERARGLRVAGWLLGGVGVVYIIQKAAGYSYQYAPESSSDPKWKPSTRKNTLGVELSIPFDLK